MRLYDQVELTTEQAKKLAEVAAGDLPRPHHEFDFRATCADEYADTGTDGAVEITAVVLNPDVEVCDPSTGITLSGAQTSGIELQNLPSGGSHYTCVRERERDERASGTSARAKRARERAIAK
jgi:hypothetical protein